MTDAGDARIPDLRGVLVDGATIRFGAGEHSLSLGEAVRQLEYRPFPRDVTLIGGGATKTLLRVQISSAHATGPIMNLVFSGMSLVIDDDLFSTYGDDAVCVRFANCRIATRGLQLRGAGALWFDNCEIDGTWEGGSSGRPVVARSDGGLVRFDRCALRLCPPLEAESVRAAVLTSCTLRDQNPFSRLEGSNVRLTSTIVQSLATREEWNLQLRNSRPLKVDEVSSRRR